MKTLSGTCSSDSGMCTECMHGTLFCQWSLVLAARCSSVSPASLSLWLVFSSISPANLSLAGRCSSVSVASLSVHLTLILLSRASLCSSLSPGSTSLFVVHTLELCLQSLFSLSSCFWCMTSSMSLASLSILRSLLSANSHVLDSCIRKLIEADSILHVACDLLGFRKSG